LLAEAEEDNLAVGPRWVRWFSCSLCEQNYHGIVKCALGWACWKTYVGRQEDDNLWVNAMTLLGNGLTCAQRHEDALSVLEAELALQRRLGDSEGNILAVQSNLASTYALLRRPEALSMGRDVYLGNVKLHGEESKDALIEASNYGSTLLNFQRFGEAKPLLRKVIPVARRVLGASHVSTLRMRWGYAESLYRDDIATLDDLREAVTTLESVAPSWKRIYGEKHPETPKVQNALANARAALRARETPPLGSA
jgi:hypothetical protein